MTIALLNPFILEVPVTITRTFFEAGYTEARSTTVTEAMTAIKTLNTTEVSANYAAFWQITFDSSDANDDVNADLFETSIRQNYNIEVQDTATDRLSGGGLYTYAGGTNKTFQVRIGAEATAAGTYGYAGYDLSVLQLDTSDLFQTNLTQTTTTSTTMTSRVSVTITEPGDYIVIVSCALQALGDARLFDGTTAYGTLGVAMNQDTTSYSPYFFFRRFTGLTNETLSLQWRSTSGAAVGIRGASILALKLDKFQNVYYDELATEQSSTSATDLSPLNPTFTIANPTNNHLILGCAHIKRNATASRVIAKLRNITTSTNYIPEHDRENNATTEFYPTIVSRIEPFSSASQNIAWQYRGSSTAATSHIKNMAIAIFDLGA